MIVKMCAGHVRDVGKAGDAKISPATVETAYIWGGDALTAKYIHEVYVVFAVRLRVGNVSECDFSFDGFEESANSGNPAILEVVEINLGVF